MGPSLSQTSLPILNAPVPTKRQIGPAIKLTNLKVARDGLEILSGCNTTIRPASCLRLLDRTGLGKQHGQCYPRLIEHTGNVTFEWLTPNKRQKPRLGFVPQRLDFDRGTPITVLDFLAKGIQRWPLWLGTLPATRESAKQVLRMVKAEHLFVRPLGKLSGGELQRVQLALALQHEPEVLVLDEPVSGVDIVGERNFCELLDQLQREHGFTTLMVTHDLSVVQAHAHWVIGVNKTIRTAGPPDEVLRNERLVDVFGPHSGLYGFSRPECSHWSPDATLTTRSSNLSLAVRVHSVGRS